MDIPLPLVAAVGVALAGIVAAAYQGRAALVKAGAEAAAAAKGGTDRPATPPPAPAAPAPAALQVVEPRALVERPTCAAHSAQIEAIAGRVDRLERAVDAIEEREGSDLRAELKRALDAVSDRAARKRGSDG